MARRFVLGAVATGLALAMVAGGAQAGTVFDYTGSLDTFSVPTTGAYLITVFGAAGGAGYQGGKPAHAPTAVAGGLGAEIGGKLKLTAGETLTILVGGQGGSDVPPVMSAGGGGGG